MKVTANNFSLELFNGAKVRDAIMKYYSEKDWKCPGSLPQSEDKYGNIVSDDGELSDGDELFFGRTKRNIPLPLLLVFAAILSAILGSCITGSKSYSGGKKEREAVIFAVNDMHAAIDNFPKLAYIVDSLRSVYPSMILVSAGDNQTGNPVNDQYKERGLPVINLMNTLKFDLSAVGNHEFDSHQKGFSNLIHLASFPFICANAVPDDSLGIKFSPFKIIKLRNNLRIAFLGLIEINENGIPDSHPDNVKGFTFKSGFETIGKYLYLRDQCDIYIVLSHLGFESDIKLAETAPAGIDLIIGGHSHTMIAKDQIFNGIMITQAGSKLKYGTLIKLTLKHDGTLERSMGLINIGQSKKENPLIRSMIDKFNDNPGLKEVIASATDDLSSHEELGYLMADAQRYSANADIALVNPGGVRIDNLPKGPVTIMNIYQLDPFGNELVLTKLTGNEIISLMFSAYKMDNNHPLFPSGIKVKLKLENGNLKDITLFNYDGSPIDTARSYTVAMNNYMTSVYKYRHNDPGQSLYITSAEATIAYLKKIHNIRSYRNEKRVSLD